MESSSSSGYAATGAKGHKERKRFDVKLRCVKIFLLKRGDERTH